MIQPRDLYVSWDDYHRLIEQLAVSVYQSQWSFDQIVCLARGGLRVGDILSRLYRRPLAVLSASSYNVDQSRGSLSFAQSLTMTSANLGPRILIVDDLVDSGQTLAQTLPWLERQHQILPEQCRTAVLWYKACSSFRPDFFAQYLPENPWIHQPFERYDKASITEL